MASSSVGSAYYNNDESKPTDDVYAYHITLEQTSSESELDPSDTESVESHQANTTVSAKDSSDISTDELSDFFMSEYEVASSPETIEPSIYDKELFSSSSSPRDIEFVFGCSESEKSDITDVSDTSDILGALGDNKYYHTCAQCFSYNANPAFRFCDSCYQLRKSSYPTKPKRKRKRNNAENPTKKQRTAAKDDIPEVDSNEANASSGCGILDSGFESLSPSAEWEISELEPKEKCLTCLDSCVNGLFLHGRTAHKCCCYKCAKLIWSKSRKCPICRRKIHNVVLLLNC
ncbi:E3 ubiquitin-protein ligase Mdm2-like [Planococcus citri]|uniref:E3 ubiquitin-protein ligase Mdm2-like n=1 Tax=Planococcus citri TaxID=170843 RepID=UPI0031F91D60